MWPASQSPYPIYDQKLRFSNSYPIYDLTKNLVPSVFMTVAADTVSLNIIYEGFAFFILGDLWMNVSSLSCERLKLPVVIKNLTNSCRQKLPDCLHLMILEAVLHLLVLKRGNLFDENYLTNCDGAHYFGNRCDKGNNYKVFSYMVFCSGWVTDLPMFFSLKLSDFS